MFIEYRTQADGPSVACSYECDGCGRVSRRAKTRRLPQRWKEVMEPRYSASHKRIYGGGYVMNCYCPECVIHGVTCHTGAAERRKMKKADGAPAPFAVAKDALPRVSHGAAGLRGGEEE